MRLVTGGQGAACERVFESTSLVSLGNSNSLPPHIDEVEPLQEAGPRLFKLYEERKDLPLLRVLVQAVASGTGRPEEVWSQMAPNMSLAAARAHAGEPESAV